MRDPRRLALAAVMCPSSHEGTNGIFEDGSRCYVCIARSFADELDSRLCRCHGQPMRKDGPGKWRCSVKARERRRRDLRERRDEINAYRRTWYAKRREQP